MTRSFASAAEIRVALRRFDRRTQECCQAHDISADQYVLMLLIKGSADGSESATVSELASRLQLARHGVAERVARAVVAGLISRETNPADRRSSLIKLTPEGERRLRAAFRDLGEESDLLLDLLGEIR